MHLRGDSCPRSACDLGPSFAINALAPLRRHDATAKLLCGNRHRRLGVTQKHRPLIFCTALFNSPSLPANLELLWVTNMAMSALLSVRATLRAPEPSTRLALAHAMQLGP